MKNDKPSTETRKFLMGLFTGLLFCCILGFMLAKSKKTFSVNNEDNELTATSTPEVVFTPSFTITPTSAYDNALTNIATPTPLYTPSIIGLPSPAFLTISSTACGNHITYSANTETTQIPIIEEDKIVEYATYVLVIYTVKNTYVNTPIYGFKIHPSPGYDNPAAYPHKSPMFVSDPLIQPNEEVTLKSEHLFVPDNWNAEEHPTAFWKFPENLHFHPHPYESALGGYTVTFQIFELFNFSKPEELRCEGVVRIK